MFNTNVIISYAVTLLDIPLGVLAATWLSKKNKIAPLLLTFDAVLYGVSNILSQNYALGLVNIFLIPILWMVAMFILWPKQYTKNNQVITRKLNLKLGISLVLLIIFFASLLGVLQMEFLGKTKDDMKGPLWLKNFSIWFDSFAASMMVMAVIMGIFRFRETWYLYFVANFLKLILFSISLFFGNIDNLLLIVIAFIYFINTIFGMMIWSSSEVQEIKI